jgi:hypothetical protein
MQQLKDFNTLAEAKAYQTTQDGYISANLMNSLLAQNGLTRAMQIISETDGHPAQNAMISFFDPRSTEYNFIQGNSTGDAQIALLDTLIDAGSALDTVVAGQTIAVATKFSELKPTLIALCNKTYFPYENTTQHAFELAKGTINRSPISHVDGIVQITTTFDVENHNPQVYYKSPNVNYFKRVGGFTGVSTAGTYYAEVPRMSNLWVDNEYGAIQ